MCVCVFHGMLQHSVCVCVCVPRDVTAQCVCVCFTGRYSTACVCVLGHSQVVAGHKRIDLRLERHATEALPCTELDTLPARLALQAHTGTIIQTVRLRSVLR